MNILASMSPNLSSCLSNFNCLSCSSRTPLYLASTNCCSAILTVLTMDLILVYACKSKGSLVSHHLDDGKFVLIVPVMTEVSILDTAIHHIGLCSQHHLVSLILHQLVSGPFQTDLTSQSTCDTGPRLSPSCHTHTTQSEVKSKLLDSFRLQLHLQPPEHLNQSCRQSCLESVPQTLNFFSFNS